MFNKEKAALVLGMIEDKIWTAEGDLDAYKDADKSRYCSDLVHRIKLLKELRHDLLELM